MARAQSRWRLLERANPSGRDRDEARAIATLAQSVGHAIYWLGPTRDTTYEVTRAANGKIYVRYLPSGVEVGSSKPYLTVATYPFPGTYAAIRKKARAKGAVTARLSGGGVAVLDAGYPQSVHIGYPHVDYQIEVYDPTPAGDATRVVGAAHEHRQPRGDDGRQDQHEAHGRDACGPPDSRATSRPPDLLGRPQAWLHVRAEHRLERERVHPLPAFRRGSRRPEGAVPDGGDLPVSGRPRGRREDREQRRRIELDRGGIGVVDSATRRASTSRTPADYQIEVYDPSPSTGRQLVAAGAISPVP